MSRRVDALYEVCLEADRALGARTVEVAGANSWRASAQRDTYDSGMAESDEEPPIPRSCDGRMQNSEYARLIGQGNRVQGQLNNVKQRYNAWRRRVRANRKLADYWRAMWERASSRCEELREQYMVTLDRMTDAGRDGVHFSPRVLEEGVLSADLRRQHTVVTNEGYYLMFEI